MNLHKNQKMCIFALPEIIRFRYAMDTLKVVLTTKSNHQNEQDFYRSDPED